MLLSMSIPFPLYQLVLKYYSYYIILGHSAGQSLDDPYSSNGVQTYRESFVYLPSVDVLHLQPSTLQYLGDAISGTQEQLVYGILRWYKLI